jgi:hypothetical protein
VNETGRAQVDAPALLRMFNVEIRFYWVKGHLI